MLALFGAKASFSLNTYLHNYFNPNIYLSFHLFCPFIYSVLSLPVLSHFQFLQSYKKMSINKSCLVCDMCEKYAFLVTLRLLGSMKSGKAEPHNTFIGKAKPNYAYQNLLKCFITSQCRFQAVACISTTKMYPRKWVLPTNINPKINIRYCHFCTAFKSCLFFVQVQ